MLIYDRAPDRNLLRNQRSFHAALLPRLTATERADIVNHMVERKDALDVVFGAIADATRRAIFAQLGDNDARELQEQ